MTLGLCALLVLLLALVAIQSPAPLPGALLEIARFPQTFTKTGVLSLYVPAADNHWCERESLVSWVVFTPMRVIHFWVSAVVGIVGGLHAHAGDSLLGVGFHGTVKRFYKTFQP